MRNPYDDRLRQLPAFGRFEAKVPAYLAEVSLDPAEEVLSAVKCNHGQGKVGYPTITNQRLRWFQRLLFKAHDHWPLNTTMVLEQPFPATIALGTGQLFQSRGFDPRPFREFVSLHQQMIEALRWEVAHAAPQPVPVPVVVANTNSGLAEQLDRLAEQRERGLLTAAEFEAAKRQLLGLTA